MFCKFVHIDFFIETVFDNWNCLSDLVGACTFGIEGHHGLVGSAIWNNLKKRGYNNLVGRSHKELDLTDQYAVEKFFDEEKPDAVVLAAAFVGGIMANSL